MKEILKHFDIEMTKIPGVDYKGPNTDREIFLSRQAHISVVSLCAPGGLCGLTLSKWKMVAV
ncbi:MAG: hypothetical protein L6Q97_15030 [Thermoanaerobaculia bacterium]|nr:hypothetical protein [Thermoanaerobaculia bacterium]